ncbi:MAG TPA: hypothetical protein DCQ25_02610 [Elusimicrobia bacterium]|nr:hypothetical protein [Elusimicrobiota bacterium]
MSSTERGIWFVRACQRRLVLARPAGGALSWLFNVCETINLYYNGLISVLCREKILPRQGLAVFCLPMPKLILLIIIAASTAAFAADAAAQDRGAAESGFADKDFRNRRKALESLGEVKEPWKMDLLKKSLSDEDPVIREKAARLIGKSKDKAAYKLLTDSLKSSDNDTRLGAIDGLRDLGDKRAAAPLAALLSHPDRNTRWKAAEALGSLKSDNGVAALQKAAAQDKDEFVRKAAVESLGKIGSQRARTALNALRAGADKRLAGWAGNVLKAMGAK